MTGEAPARLPRWPVRWSVRSRILASILLVAALGLVGAGVTTYVVQRDRVLAGVDERLESRVDAARQVAMAKPTAERAAFATTGGALEAVLGQVIPNRNESSLGIVGGEARFVPVNTQLHLENDPAFIARVVGDVAGGRVWLGSTRSTVGRLRYIAVPIAVGGANDPGIYVDAVDLDAELADLTAAFSTYVLVALAALAAIGLVGWFVAGRLLRPIRQLSAAASRITASERNERIPVAGSDDVSELTRTVNDMLDRLDLALTSQRQLLDDVRHELKTPITILRGHLELLDTANAREVDATRALAIDELDRMSALVDDIESLAENQRDALSRQPTDIADLTADVFAIVSGIPGHEWSLAEVAHLSVELDPARITQAWLQLADNAAKYSPSGSRVELGSRRLDDSVEFWVTDAGPGIPRESWERIFERFGRVDTGRGIRGSGLGLPIVKAIALAHGGRVSLFSSSAGSRFAIVVPAGAAAYEEVP
jgi:signal transduction histidine kinase